MLGSKSSCGVAPRGLPSPPVELAPVSVTAARMTKSLRPCRTAFVQPRHPEVIEYPLASCTQAIYFERVQRVHRLLGVLHRQPHQRKLVKECRFIGSQIDDRPADAVSLEIERQEHR